MIPSGDLREMIGELAALDRQDREFVLAELGQDAAQRLLPLIEAASKMRMSTALARAVGEARQGAIPEGMTQRAALALADAAQALVPAVAAASGNGKAASLPQALWRTIRGQG